jgi:hypothetical protein
VWGRGPIGRIEHLAAFPAELDELVFRNERGGPLLRANFRQRVWLPALDGSGLVERPKFLIFAIAMRPGWCRRGCR